MNANKPIADLQDKLCLRVPFIGLIVIGIPGQTASSQAAMQLDFQTATYHTFPYFFSHIQLYYSCYVPQQADQCKYAFSNKASNPRDFANLQRYQSRQPSIYNQFFGINLIEAVQKLPPLSRQAPEASETNLQQNRTETKGIGEECEIEHRVLAYHHEIDRLGQDTQVNQYVIGNVLLGRGAHSTVRLAKCQDRFYAVKILWFEKIKKKYFLKQKQLTKMINAQINLLLRLKHPNIIQFRQAIYAQEKERIFIVLEYCAKGSLLNIYNARLSVSDEEWHRQVQGYFAQMTEAIAFIHENGVIHRDIKPENMLINDQEQLKIIDFNISQVLLPEGTIRVTNKFIGTKGYASPQLIIGTEKEKWTSGKALDIWSLGITLLELLQRKHPFSIKTIEELHKYLSQDIPINAAYPDDLRSLLSGMLKRNSAERMTIKQVRKHSWVRNFKR